MKRFLLLFLLLLAPLMALAPRALAQDPGFGKYRNTALSATEVAIKTSSANVFGYTFINVNTTAVYVKFFNGTVANVVVGTTPAQSVIMIPPGDGTTPGIVYLAPETVSYQYFQLALTVAAVTGLADSSTAAPATPIYVEVLYK